MYFRNKQGIFWTLFFPGFIMIIFGFQSVFSVSENPQISVFISENPSNNSQQKLTEKEEILLNNISNDIKDNLYETNLLRERNDLIPYGEMGRTFLINKVKILNHQWVVANFSDGTYWGEIFLTYQIDKNGGLDFELKEHFIYPDPD